MSDVQTEARAIAERLSIHHSDVDRIAIIATALAAKDAELAAEHAALRLAADRADRAEAQLAEANKALEEIADAKTELTNRHDYSRGWNDALFRVRQIARRAREQGGE